MLLANGVKVFFIYVEHILCSGRRLCIRRNSERAEIAAYFSVETQASETVLS